MTAPTWDSVVADLATLRAAADTQTAAAKVGADLLAAATAANATLSAELASVRVSPPTLYGYTPHGPQNATGLAASASKFGKPPLARLFWTGFGTLPMVAPTTPPHIVGSCKALLPDAQQAAWQAAMWRHTLLHEIDVKRRNGWLAANGWTVDKWRTEMLRLRALPGGNPDGQSIILTSWTFDPVMIAKGDGPDGYWIDGIPHLGVDFDGPGTDAKGNVLPDLSVQLANVAAFAKRVGCTWGVAEFGGNIDRANDPDGRIRAAWMSRWAHRFADAGAEYVCLWEWDQTPSSLLTAPAEVAVWSSFVQASS